MNAIRELARLHGIADAYLNWRGEEQQVTLESQIAILAAIGIEAADEQAAESAVHQHATVSWTRLVPQVIVTAAEAPFEVPVSVPLDLAARSISWSAALEGGAQRTGSADLERLAVLEEGSAEARSYRRVGLALDALPPGYHTVSITLDTGLSGELKVIATPQRCYEPPALAAGRRVWGLAVQLYSLRSARNWGIGDLSDLCELIRASAPLGCAVVGLNPLHALLPGNPEHVSPYNPSSRHFLNALYIAVEDAPDFAECEAARARVAAEDFQALLRELRESPNVQYARVAAAKFEILKLLYESFRAQHISAGSERAQAFQRFIDTHGDALRLHAVYDALDAHLRLQGPQYWGWPSWPEDYRDPMTPVVNRFARQRAQEVEYFLYLQWLAAEQLHAAQTLARELGMSVGLYGDVAVGASSAGSETWSNRHLYRQGASIGAPPDSLAPKGQDWGIPPQDPSELRAQQYRPFIELVRNNMRHVAALRLDHVMALYRLWWVPRGHEAKDGSYVHYPLEDLIAIVALESHRNRCLVIGEDLGTVPEAMTRAMERYHAYHYKVLLFEREPNGPFKPPSAYVPAALATVTTHDLPTLRGWWQAHDIALRERLNLYPSEALLDAARAERAVELKELTLALVRANLWQWRQEEPLPPYSDALARAVHVFLARSNAALAMLQIEDLIGMADPVNVPGTHDEHDNWQRKLTLETEEIFVRGDVRDVLAAVDRERKNR